MSYFKNILAFALLANIILFVYESHVLSLEIQSREAQLIHDISSIKREYFLGFIWPTPKTGNIPTPHSCVEGFVAVIFLLAALPIMVLLNAIAFIPMVLLRPYRIRPYPVQSLYFW
jgi:hypothetical protein